MVDGLGCGTMRFLVAFLLAGGIVAGSVEAGQTLSAFTVPATALPTGCALRQPAPRPATTSRGRVMVIDGVTSPCPTNPWSGTDSKVVAAVRKAIDATQRVPDGPPLDARAAAVFELKWADNILEAYHAAYSSANGSEVEVFAVTFNNVKLVPPEPPSEMLNRPRGLTSRIVRGATVVRVFAPTPTWLEKDALVGVTECFGAVRAHIESLK